jgi:YD repeat-containing protein
MTGTRVTTIFDAAGQATGWSDANGIWTRSYDGAGQLLTEAAPSHPNGQPLTNVYVTLDGVETMTCDAANQLLSEYHPISGVGTAQVTFTSSSR